jgi:AraC-like DNA-binding protein
MKNFSPRVIIVIVILNITLAYTQTKLPVLDSLDTLSYKELGAIIQNTMNEELRKECASKYLLKAKTDNDIKRTLNGYWYITDVCDFAMAIKYNDTMISLAKRKYPKYISTAFLKRGQLYYGNKKLKLALDFYLMAYNNVEENSFELKNNIMQSIGVIKSSQGYYQEALSIFLKCEAFSNQYQSPDPNTIFDIAEMYLKLNQIEKSEAYTDKGLKLCEKENNTLYEILFIANRGKNYFKRKKYREAIVDLKLGLKPFREEIKDFTNYSENCFYIGKSYVGLHEKEKAIVYFEKVDSIFTKEKNVYPEIFENYAALIDYYKSKKDYQKTLLYTERLIKIDSIANHDYKYITDKIHKKYDVPELMASRQEIINNLESKQHYSLVAIITLIIGLTLLSVFFVNYKKRRKIELQKQKLLFDEFMSKHNLEKQELLVKETHKVVIEEVIQKINAASSIDPKVVETTLIKLAKFEKDKKFIKKDYTTESLAAEFKTNSNYLSKIINEYRGCTFPIYINNLRIDYIIERLENESIFRHYTIKVIAESGGYNNVQSFARAFLSRTNINPSFFIKELINSNK